MNKHAPIWFLVIAGLVSLFALVVSSETELPPETPPPKPTPVVPDDPPPIPDSP
ncbi:MAG: hypothetical protein KatS3mg105_3317 [Gemmatales bacterium]|nr:MAG: hypothetical protein KatS3mg105_3317 [Gemmatales bacterium]